MLTPLTFIRNVYKFCIVFNNKSYPFLQTITQNSVLNLCLFKPPSLVCCQPPRHKATTLSALEMLCDTQLVPSVTNIFDDCSISARWTLNLLCGRCFIYLRHHSESIETSITGNRQRTSGPGTILPF